ncbi:MAG: MBL fold metallo-hydrolase [Nitrospirae bacterium]|nr:MBL fold metallo-hydrolase [Nitrospirota bacterium]
MKITFWGVRGSLPSPGTGTVRYGGNTTCISVETDDGQLIVLDAGTGIYKLSQALLGRLPVSCSLFITHTHWDHIQGLPFFIPLFIPGNRIQIYGAFDPISGKSIKDVLSGQMEYCYFPVRQDELRAEIHYMTLHEKQTVEIGQAKVTTILMNHPVLNFGYKIECGGKSVFFTGDNEPLYNIYSPGDDFHQEYGSLISSKDATLLDFIHGIDVLIADSAFTADEYPAKKGWGHGTFDSCIAMARKAGANKLYFTHHEPLRRDEDLDAIERRLREHYPAGEGMPSFTIAYEGLEILL